MRSCEDCGVLLLLRAAALDEQTLDFRRQRVFGLLMVRATPRAWKPRVLPKVEAHAVVLHAAAGRADPAIAVEERRHGRIA